MILLPTEIRKEIIEFLSFGKVDLSIFDKKKKELTEEEKHYRKRDGILLKRLLDAGNKLEPTDEVIVNFQEQIWEIYERIWEDLVSIANGIRINNPTQEEVDRYYEDIVKSTQDLTNKDNLIKKTKGK